MTSERSQSNNNQVTGSNSQRVQDESDLLRESLKSYMEVCRYQSQLLAEYQKAQESIKPTSEAIGENQNSNATSDQNHDVETLRNENHRLYEEVEKLKQRNEELLRKFEGMHARWLSVKEKLEAK